jgi:ATP-dependent exoDNAse (exonuclease V) beta subunit
MNDCLNSSLVLLASAGTGKTFALSNRFLELAANGVPLQSILGTTFTRKAAGEILDRILLRLSEAALDESKFAELTGFISTPPGWSRQHATQLLRTMLNDLHRFEVRTLDAWFQQNLNVVALEKGLPPGWSVSDPFELDELRAQAILEVIGKLDVQEADNLLRDLQQREFKRSVYEGLLDLLNNTLAMHLSAGSRQEVWQGLSECKDPSKASMQEVCLDLDALETPKTAKGSPNKNWDKALKALRQCWADQDWKSLLSLTLIGAVLEEKDKFARIAISDRARNVLSRAAKLAAAATLADLHRSNLALCALVSAYSETYQQLKQKAGRYDFDDIPRLLADTSQSEVVNHRLGRKVKHLLLDEFQDTSVLQWQVLEPLIEETVLPPQTDSSMLCVGDVKQAIYGWREGESDLLTGIPEWYGVPAETKAKNYRSSQKVLDAVNVVFSNLNSGAPVIADSADAQTLESIRDWAEGFPKHEAAKDLPGSVWLLQCQAEKRKGSTPKVMQLVIDRIEDLHRQAPEASIGVLVRRKRDIQTLLLALKRLGIRASGEGGNLLTDSQAVQLALSLFRLADHPADTAAFFHLATSSLAPFFTIECDLEKGLRSGARRLSRHLRRRLQDDGCGQLLLDLAQHMEDQQLFDAWNRHRFGQLIALGLQFEKRNELRADRFVDLVERTPVGDPMAAPVRIMTVHASKGLEFDAVLLPFFDAGAKPRNLLVSQRIDSRRGFNLLSLAPSKAVIPFSAPLKVMTNERIRRDIQEDLCVLYVAMTRARQRLEIILPPPIKNSSVFRTENLLRATMVDGFLEPHEIPHADVLWHNATHVEFHHHAAEPKQETAMQTPLPSKLCLQETRGKRSLPRWSPSSTEGDGLVGGSALLSTSASAARSRGTAIHRLFEEIMWLDNFQANDQQLLHLLSECGYTGSAAMDLICSFRDALDQPAVKMLLSRPQEYEEVDVWREQTFAVAMVDEHGADSILNGIFDRVEIHKTGGEITSAVIIDFKTGAVAGELDLLSKADFYRSQMRAYRKALCARTGLHPDAISCQLLFVDAGLVAEV